MARSDGPGSRVGAVLALALSLGSGVLPGQGVHATEPCAATAPAWLKVYFNGRLLGDALGQRFAGRAGLWVESAVLEREQALQGAVRLARRTEQGEFASLQSIAGLRAECAADSGRLELWMTVKSGRHTRLVVNEPAPIAPLSSGVGARLDYNLFARTGLESMTQPDVSLLLDGLGFAGPVRLRHTGLAQRRTTTELARLDSTLEGDWLQANSLWQLGDFVSSPDGLGQRFRMGGISLRRAFEFRPLEITYPVPLIQGTAVLPSTLDLFIDGIRRGRFEVDEGEFTMADAPPLTGAGIAEVIVTNILGEQQRLTQPFFVVEDLLRPGLWDYAMGLGLQREVYGEDWGRYGTPQVTAETRYGASPLVTLEARGRAEEDAHNVELGLLARIPRWPIRAGATLGHYALPDGGRGGLHQWQLGWRYGRLFADVSERQTHPASGTSTASLPYDLQRRAQIGTQLRGWSVVAAYLRNDSALGELRSSNLRLARSFRHLSGAAVSLTLFSRTLDGARSKGWLLTTSWSPANRHQVVANIDDEGAGQVQYFRQRESDLGQQWGVLAGRSDHSGWRGNLFYDGRSSQLAWNAQLAADGSSESLSVGAQGSLGWVDGVSFIGRETGAAFAVLDTPGLVGARVYRNRQLAARTDASGRAVITHLLPYQDNELRIAAEDVPLDQSLAQTRWTVRPGQSTGLRIQAEGGAHRDIRVRLLGVDDRPVPPGARLSFPASPASGWVGRDGRAYAEDLHGTETTGWARWPGGQCAFSLPPDGVQDGPEFAEIWRCE